MSLVFYVRTVPCKNHQRFLQHTMYNVHYCTLALVFGFVQTVYDYDYDYDYETRMKSPRESSIQPAVKVPQLTLTVG